MATVSKLAKDDMLDHTSWAAGPQIMLDLQKRLIEDRGLLVTFAKRAPHKGKVLTAPVVDRRGEYVPGDLEYCAPQLIGKICSLLDGDPTIPITLGPVAVSGKTARISVKVPAN